MIKIMSLLFVVIAPTITGIAVVAVLAMSSPIDGGTPLSQQGSIILMVVAGAALISLPISYIVARMVNRLTSANVPVVPPVAAAPVEVAPLAVAEVQIPQALTEAEQFAQAQAEALTKA